MMLNRIRIVFSRSHCMKNRVITHQRVLCQVRHRHSMTTTKLPVAHSTNNLRFIRFKHVDLKTIKPFILPDIGEGINEVEVKSWLVKVGDAVKEFDGLCEVESDKATVTISSRFEGIITKIHYENGSIAKVGKPLVDIEMSSGDEADKQIENDTKYHEQTFSSNESRPQSMSTETHKAPESYDLKTQVATLPSVRRLAKEKGIDLSLVKPTGKQGQILKEDVLSYLRGGEQLVDKTIASENKLETQVPLNSIKRAMYKTMTQSAKIPHFNYSDEIDMTRMVELIKLRNSSKSEDKLSSLAIIIKLVSLALKDYPQLNASLDESGTMLIEKHYHNIGVAVDTKAGLIVPNIKNVQNLSVSQINLELLRLRKLAYDSKLGPADLSGGTITLSNIGAIGGIFGVPVLVSPEIVIGALGRTRGLPRFNAQGGIDERQVMQLVWSADHRVVDGATLSRFTNLLKHYLEEPGIALLNMV